MGHAILSPSASGRWLSCPASIRMTRDIPYQPASIYAIEGTQFHTLCEITARQKFLGSDTYPLEFLEWSIETPMDWHEQQFQFVEDYLDLLQGFLDEEDGARLLLEERVDTDIPGCWGTADAIIVYSDRVRVIDIKYGAGARVSALENSQLRLYGLGALNTLFRDRLPIREITTTIWQPRMNNLSEETLTRTELEAWGEDVLPIAKLALGEDAPFGPSESACRWCPISGECAPRTRWMLNQDYGNPDLLDNEEMADAYSRIPALKSWVADIEDAALKRAYETEGSVPGYKVVRSGGRRSITNDDKAIAALLKAAPGYGFEPNEVFTRKVATLGYLDKLVGPQELQQILGDLLVKSEGRLSLAPESDPRPPADAFHSAKSDFADITEGEA
jgi:hypothetical protein